MVCGFLSLLIAERDYAQPRINPREANMAVPVMNADIISVSMDRGTGQYKVAKADQALLLRIIGELQFRIDTEMGANPQGPLRFVIPLAMRFTEQAGRMSFRKPKGNNPYNIMGPGFDRPDNKEYECGTYVTRAASFRGYASEAEGVAAGRFGRPMAGRGRGPGTRSGTSRPSRPTRAGFVRRKNLTLTT